MIKQRRSALGLDGRTAIAAETFYAMLDRLYHFTVGGPVDDPRLTTLPGYFHLDRSSQA